MKIRQIKFGFTLVEMLVVISIIGILASITIVGVQSAREKSKVSKAKNDISNIALSVSMLYADTRVKPFGNRGNENLDAINSSPVTHPITHPCSGLITTPISTDTCSGSSTSGMFPSTWKGAYYKGTTSDPWGHPYKFVFKYIASGESKYQNVILSGGKTGITTGTNVDSNACDDIYKSVFKESVGTVPADQQITSCPNFQGEVE